MAQIENVTLLEVNKPERLKQTLNELIDNANSQEEYTQPTKESIGLGNVDNTSDLDKPVSTAQATAIANAKAECVKLASATKQVINSDIQIVDGKKITLTRGNNTEQDVATITNSGGYENMNIGSQNIPLKLLHSKKDVNETVVPANPKVSIKDENGTVSEETIAFLSDVVRKNVLASAETANGVVSAVDGQYFTDVNTDSMSLHVVVRSVVDGSKLSDTVIPLKVASAISRGLMSKEQVASLNDCLSRISNLEGKAARYLYTDKASPTAQEIDDFVNNLGGTSPYTGISVVVADTLHIWNYYQNDNIGWRDDGCDTVQKATNSSLGIVIGSNTDGKIYIETDGSMSVVGFDTLSGKVTSLENTSVTGVTVESGTNNGTIKVTVTINGTATTVDNIAVTGLGSMAYQSTSSYPTTNDMNTAINTAIANAITTALGGNY